MTGQLTCAVPNCPRKRSPRMLMCGPCWGSVPPDLQKRVHRTYGAWMRKMGDTHLLLQYRAAAKEAIEAV